MRTQKIVNPRTGRTVAVRTWRIEPRKVLDGFKAGTFKTARDLSWALLNAPESVEEMAAELGGEAAGSNFALAVFEQALDWGLGLRVISFLRQAAAVGDGRRLPKPFDLAVTRAGDIFVIGASGRIYE